MNEPLPLLFEALITRKGSEIPARDAEESERIPTAALA
jgi:hypothetical protein